jgi:hypothetical protein
MEARKGSVQDDDPAGLAKLVQPEASSQSLRLTLSSELASDKLYENQ